MGRPKKVVIPQGEKTTKKEESDVAIVAQAESEKKEQTPIKSVKVEKVKVEPRPLKKGDTFLFVKDGMDVYYTRTVANVIFIRNSASMVIPKAKKTRRY